MITYSKFRPTGFDSRGLGLEDRQDWLVAPVSRTRDSGCLEESNFECALKLLGGEGDSVEVHRFGHWGPGWFEIILVQPGTPAEKEAEEIEAALENYPVLDDEDFSRREHEGYCESWESWGANDFVGAIASELELEDEAHWKLQDVDTNKLMELYEKQIPSGDYQQDGAPSQIRRAAQSITLEDVQGLLATVA